MKNKIKFKKYFLITIGTLYSLSSFSQNDTIWEFNKYVIFKGDTLNRHNNCKQKQGKWIFYSPKNTYKIISVEEGYSYNPHITNIEKNGEKCTIYDSDYIIEAEGYFRNELKDSVWRYFHNNGVLNKEVWFKNGDIKNSFTIYNRKGEVIIEIDKINCDTFLVKKFTKEQLIFDHQFLLKKEIDEIFLSLPKE